MTPRTWVILGATSIIAEEFAKLAAQQGHSLRLVGRDKSQLDLIAQDIQIRYKISCEVLLCDLSEVHPHLDKILNADRGELDLFIAFSDFSGNAHLTSETITHLINLNILSTTLIINAYLNTRQKEHRLLYLSSVAADRGRAKNSLYGASKAAIEVYLEGLQQAAVASQYIGIVRLGFIDTRQTYGVPGVFYAAPPKECAQACFKAVNKKKRLFYYPGFWRYIMAVITPLPFFIYKKMAAM